MKRNSVLLLALLLGAFFTSTLNAKKVHTIGDSTMATYDETSDKRGWGQMFNQFFTDDITVNNRAKSGASSKSFYNEAPYWATVKTQIEPGDYVLIQFAHNDEKNNGYDGDELQAANPDSVIADTRGTAPFTTYKDYLRKYIDETRELEATPILVTPIVRRYFSGGKITQKGRHNLSAQGEHDLDYVQAMKEVAAEKEVSLIDHTELTAAMVEAYGDVQSKEQLYCQGDDTHTSATGAMLFARLVAQEMTRQDILAQYIDAEASLIVNPDVIDFGRGYPGAVKSVECTVMGMDLDPAEGEVVLSTESPFAISTDGETYSTRVSLGYTDSNLALSRFYVNCVSDGAGIIFGTLTVSNGSVERTLTMTMEVVDLGDGEPFSVYWQLNQNDDCVVEGAVTPLDESWSKMYVQKYAAPKNDATTWPENSGHGASDRTQRNLIEGDEWPGNEIDAVSDRYIQFAVAANPGTEFTVDTIGIYIGGAGGNGMRWRVEYSIDENFGNEVVVSEFLSPVSNTMYANEVIPMVKVPEGQTLYLRIYPWYKSTATGKTLCLSDLYIGGYVSKTSNVDVIEKSSSLRYDGNTIYNNSDENIAIYDTAGCCVMKATESADLTSLPKGVYVAHSGGEVLKVMR